MNITLTAQLIAAEQKTNAKTGEIRTSLSFLDIDDTPIVRNIKAPAGMNHQIFTANIGKTYDIKLQIWNMNGGSGFFIREPSDIRLESELKKVG